jgi:hypothetical protein
MAGGLMDLRLIITDENTSDPKRVTSTIVVHFSKGPVVVGCIVYSVVSSTERGVVSPCGMIPFELVVVVAAAVVISPVGMVPTKDDVVLTDPPVELVVPDTPPVVEVISNGLLLLVIGGPLDPVLPVMYPEVAGVTLDSVLA